MEPERPIEKLLRAYAKKRGEAAGAPAELHPATRRLLQGEVARQFPQTEPARGAPSHMFRQLWPRFAWSLGILAVLAILTVQLLPHLGKGKNEATLAGNDSKAHKPATDRMDVPPASPAPIVAVPAQRQISQSNPALADADQLARNKDVLKTRPIVAETQKGLAPQAQAIPPATPVATAGPLQWQGAKGEWNANQALPAETPVSSPVPVEGAAPARFRGFAANSPGAAVAPAQPAAPPTVAAGHARQAEVVVNVPSGSAGRFGLAGGSLASTTPPLVTASATVTNNLLFGSAAPSARARRQALAVQQFAQVQPSAKAKNRLFRLAASGQPVLGSFKVEQSGNEVRLVDSDGSVYSGSLQPVHAGPAREVRLTPASDAISASAKRASEPPAAAFADEAKKPAQTYLFRVAGTNRSLNQKVIFVGNLTGDTNVVFMPNPAADQSIGGVANRDKAAFLPDNSFWLQNSSISGKLTVGNGKAIEIKAVPTER